MLFIEKNNEKDNKIVLAEIEMNLGWRADGVAAATAVRAGREGGLTVTSACACGLRSTEFHVV